MKQNETSPPTTKTQSKTKQHKNNITLQKKKTVPKQNRRQELKGVEIKVKHVWV